jgi:adenine-specific DNA methylase
VIPKECKRLAEVDFPIAVVSRHSAREKSIRHGHPSTLHLWWARRPLAACRAMLMALLLPDPVDAACPNEFKDAARKALLALPGAPSKWSKDLKSDEGLRQGLLKFIGDFANWDVASDPAYLKTSRALVKAAHREEPPLVVDPFAGGGSIPLEALRIGCDAFASDLNPVACLILKTMLEDIPRHGPGLADELRKAGEEIKQAVERELAEFYPDDPDGAKPIAYIWARTIVCDSCGAEIPLVRSFWLCKKASRKCALRPSVHPHRGRPATIEFDVFTPQSDSQVPPNTVTRAKATCLACKTVLPPARVRVQLTAQRGGADVKFDAKGERTGGARLLAVVTLHPTKSGRQYRVATDRDYAAVFRTIARLKKVAAKKLLNGLSWIPDEPTPVGGGSGAGRAFSVQKYGMMRFSDLFTVRQTLALTLLGQAMSSQSGSSSKMRALLFSKHAELMSANCPWEPVAECPRKTFNMQALPIRWEFAESVLTSCSSGGFSTTLDNVLANLESIGSDWSIGNCSLADVREHPLPDDTADIWFTDPPYYDAVPYSDLSDFFFVWLKRALPGDALTKDPYDPANPLTPKSREIVQDETRIWNSRPKDRAFFEEAMAYAFSQGRRTLRDDGCCCIVFAHKTTEGWEALLTGLVEARWIVVASWPIQTEQVNRPRARESAALATSAHSTHRDQSVHAIVITGTTAS